MHTGQVCVYRVLLEHDDLPEEARQRPHALLRAAQQQQPRVRVDARLLLLLFLVLLFTLLLLLLPIFLQRGCGARHALTCVLLHAQAHEANGGQQWQQAAQQTNRPRRKQAA